MTRYSLNETSGKVVQQEDFWDSVNLRGGAYRRRTLAFAAWYVEAEPAPFNLTS